MLNQSLASGGQATASFRPLYLPSFSSGVGKRSSLDQAKSVLKQESRKLIQALTTNTVVPLVAFGSCYGLSAILHLSSSTWVSYPLVIEAL